MKLEKRSLEELEGISWHQPNERRSPALDRCFEARKKPLSSLHDADVRVLVGQDIGLRFIMPIAVARLEKEPLLEAEYYKGDLLAAVLNASPEFFRDESALRGRVRKVIEERLPGEIEKLDAADFDVTSDALEEAIAFFNRGASSG